MTWADVLASLWARGRWWFHGDHLGLPVRPICGRFRGIDRLFSMLLVCCAWPSWRCGCWPCRRYRPNPQQSVCQTTGWPSRHSVGVHAAASLVLAALSVQTLRNLPGRICGRSLSSLVHVLLRGRPSFVYMTEIWQQSLSLLYAHVQCGPPLRFPFPRGSPPSLFFHSPARIPDLPVPVQSQGKEDCYVCSDCRCSRTCWWDSWRCPWGPGSPTKAPGTVSAVHLHCCWAVLGSLPLLVADGRFSLRRFEAVVLCCVPVAWLWIPSWLPPGLRCAIFQHENYPVAVGWTCWAGLGVYARLS